MSKNFIPKAVKRVTLVAGFSLLCYYSSVNAQSFGTDANGVETFFSAFLEKNQQGEYDGYKTIDAADINTAREMVWKAWVDANNNLKEDKLMNETMDLTQNNRASWTLPSEGGMTTVMPFYYGFKGDDLDKPAAGWPLFLYLHGSGDKDAEWNITFQYCKSFDDKPSVYFIPQIPNIGPYYRWYQQSKQYAWEKVLRLAFVRGDIDPNRVYFLGFSEGGYGSQRLASFYADYLAGAGPMAGGEPLINAPAENLRHTVYFMRTGSEDTAFSRNLMTQITKDSLDVLAKKYPGDYVHNIELVEGMGHGVEPGYATPYLKNFTRNPYPKHVNWENMEMDGRYRKGFYNICIVERTDSPNRMYIQMDIDDNVINLNVSTVKYTANTVDQDYNVVTSYKKTYEEATSGKIKLYFCPELVDFDRPIKVYVNGRQIHDGKLDQNINDIVNSCATFYDPKRLYTASFDIDLKDVTAGISDSIRQDKYKAPENTTYYNLSGTKTDKNTKGLIISSDGRKIVNR